MPAETNQGLTRREILKRGAALGGALAWSAPIVQVVGMSPALAQQTCTTYCFKFEFDKVQNGSVTCDSTSSGAPLLTGSFVGDLGGAQGCLACPPGATSGLPPNASDICFFGDLEDEVTICLPDNCTSSGTGGRGGLQQLAAKCGSRDGSCGILNQPAEVDCTCSACAGTKQVTIGVCPNGKGISHIEFVLTCCDVGSPVTPN